MNLNNNNSRGFSLAKIYKLIIFLVIVYFVISSILSWFSNNSKPETTTNPYLENHSIATDYDTSSDDLNYEVSAGVREKYTKIIGGGEDQVTVMVYMIGTDLESNYGMATKDIYEIQKGIKYDNVSIVLQTGGCSNWNNNVFSNRKVERWTVNSENLSKLVSVGNVPMTDVDTLTDFIEYSADNFPANRYVLILWDHGGGSVTGYGYDENYPNNGSLSPDMIGEALKNSKVKFDFVGFDACLMANLETAIAIEPYADYLIGSEETEPGEGWYYTNWINMLDENPSTPTIQVGKKVIDDYIFNSNRSLELTESLIDLGELVHNIKEPLTKFSKATIEKLNDNKYQQLANARSDTKEFSKSSRLDQVDLVDLAHRFNVEGSTDLINGVKSAIKYNKTRNVNSSYGLSVYFPYSSLSKLNSMVRIYDNINMNKDYADVVKSFASYASSGQIVSNNSNSSSTSIFDILSGNQYGYSDDYYSSNSIYDMLGSSYDYYDYGNYGNSDYGWYDYSMLDTITDYLFRGNYIDTNKLIITKSNNQNVVDLSNEQWNLVNNILLNVFVDDGTGYIDLGKDNTFDFNENGQLIADYDSTWLSIDDYVVAYYMINDSLINENVYKTEGIIPAYLNNKRVDLVVNFVTDQDPVILGARLKYEDNDIQQKGLIELHDGDEIKFIANYYTYDGEFVDEYQIGETYIYDSNYEIANIYLTNDYLYAYCFTDIYNNNMWTDAIKGKAD